jgi:hypothetical protein
LYEEFDAKQLSMKLQTHLIENGYAQKDPQLMKQVSTKRISNDLDRLYRMGLVNARRINRQIVTKKNKSCNKGYQYVYRVSKQGAQYWDYLVKPEEARVKKEQDKSARLLGIPLQRIRGHTLLSQKPNGVSDLGIQEIALDFEYKRGGRHRNRFPIQYGPEMALKYIVARKLLRRHGIADAEFYKELFKVTEMGNINWPHLGLQYVKRVGRKTMLDEDGENRHFLSLLGLRRNQLGTVIMPFWNKKGDPNMQQYANNT